MAEHRNIASLGETELISRIQRMLPQVSTDVVVGIGDDTAVIRLADNRLLLATTDIQIEGNHFRRDWATPEQIGRKAMAVNLSDIAAMGGTPAFALVSLSLPPDLPTDFFDALYKGILAEASPHAVSIIGGNLARTKEQILIDITLLGFVTPDKLLTRSNAKQGDRLFVSGVPGMAAAGLQILEQYGTHFPAECKPCVDALLTPTPRVALGKALAESGIVTSMIDVSDGLGTDICHLCEASHVGCELSEANFPADGTLGKVANILGKSVEELVLNSGESYELLFTVNAEVDTKQIQEIAHRSGCVCTEIGRITNEQNGLWRVTTDGKRMPISKTGWDHFAVR